MSTQTFNISFPKALVKEIDEIAEKQFASRSDFLRTAALEYIRKQQEWEYIFREGKKTGEKIGERSEDEVAEAVRTQRRRSRQWAKA